MKSPPLDRFSGGSVQRFAAGAAVDLHLFRSALIVDQHAQNYLPFTALAASALRVIRSAVFRYSALESKRLPLPDEP